MFPVVKLGTVAGGSPPEANMRTLEFNNQSIKQCPVTGEGVRGSLNYPFSTQYYRSMRSTNMKSISRCLPRSLTR
jgi:hypothetical protein